MLLYRHWDPIKVVDGIRRYSIYQDGVLLSVIELYMLPMCEAYTDSGFPGLVARFRSVPNWVCTRYSDAPFMTFALNLKDHLQQVLGPAHQNLSGIPLYFQSSASDYSLVYDKRQPSYVSVNASWPYISSATFWPTIFDNVIVYRRLCERNVVNNLIVQLLLNYWICRLTAF